jgi:hypothetical protein
MEPSVLTSTKKVLGLAEDYTAFDEDVIMHINSAFFSLHQLGVGQENGFAIEDDVAEWTDFTVPSVDLNAVKQYVYTKVRIAFDPPGTSFHIESLDKLAKELEWRLNTSREYAIGGTFPDDMSDDFIDGGPPEGWGD